MRVIAGYPAGGGGDQLVRYYAAQLEKATGQKFVVENKVGANGKIATDTTLMAKPDGYTLLIHGTAAVVGNTVLMKDPGYDAMDLQPVATLAESAFTLTVGPESKANTLKELVANLKAAGGKMKYGTATGVTLVASEKFLLDTGTKAERVNYKGTVDAAREMVSNQIDFLFADATFAVQQAKQGRLEDPGRHHQGPPAVRARAADHGRGGRPRLRLHAEMGGLVPQGHTGRGRAEDGWPAARHRQDRGDQGVPDAERRHAAPHQLGGRGDRGRQGRPHPVAQDHRRSEARAARVS